MLRRSFSAPFRLNIVIQQSVLLECLRNDVFFTQRAEQVEEAIVRGLILAEPQLSTLAHISYHL